MIRSFVDGWAIIQVERATTMCLKSRKARRGVHRKIVLKRVAPMWCTVVFHRGWILRPMYMTGFNAGRSFYQYTQREVNMRYDKPMMIALDAPGASGDCTTGSGDVDSCVGNGNIAGAACDTDGNNATFCCSSDGNTQGGC